jgi:hypothetical protein
MDTLLISLGLFIYLFLGWFLVHLPLLMNPNTTWKQLLGFKSNEPAPKQGKPRQHETPVCGVSKSPPDNAQEKPAPDPTSNKGPTQSSSIKREKDPAHLPTILSQLCKRQSHGYDI